MLKNYILILFVISFLQNNAQEVYPNLVKVNRNVTEGVKSFNIKNLKYHAKISKASIDKAQVALRNSDCEKAFDLSQTIAIYLESALLATDFATAKAHLITTEDLILRIFYEHNLCSSPEIKDSSNNSDLSALEKEQAKLKEQQAKLEEKEREIKQQLAEQKLKQNQDLKQNYIKLNNEAIASSITSYNAFLKACGCKNSLSSNNKNSEDLSVMSLEQLKIFFLEKTMGFTKSYMSLLADCKTK